MSADTRKGLKSALAQARTAAASAAPGAGAAPEPGDAVPCDVLVIPARSQPVSDEPRPGLPVHPPLAALIEVLLLVVLPTALDYWWPAFPSLTDVQPHPFWLPVLLLSLQYGTVSGLLAAGTAIAATSLLGWSEQEIGENHFSYLLRIWAQPVLWLATALVLGQFRMRQIEMKQELARQVWELSAQRAALADYAGNLGQRCERLERAIATRRLPQGRVVLSALGQLGAATSAQAATRLATCLDLAFGPVSASVFVREGDGLRLAERHGWADDAAWATHFAADHALCRAVVGSGHSLSILRPAEEGDLAGQGIAAVPILAGLEARVVGMVKLETITPEELGEDIADRLRAVAVQLAPLVARGLLGAGAAAPVPEPDAAPPLSSRARVWRQILWLRGRGAAADPQRKPSRFG